jgi:hypothetical protein
VSSSRLVAIPGGYGYGSYSLPFAAPCVVPAFITYEIIFSKNTLNARLVFELPYKFLRNLFPSEKLRCF